MLGECKAAVSLVAGATYPAQQNEIAFAKLVKVLLVVKTSALSNMHRHALSIQKVEHERKLSDAAEATSEEEVSRRAA